MDLSTLGIPDIYDRDIGPRGNPLHVVQSRLRLPAWDGYLTSRRENGRVIEDGTVIVQFACNTRSPAEYWQQDVAAYHSIIEHQYAVRDAIVAAAVANLPDLIFSLDPEELGLSHLIDWQNRPRERVADSQHPDPSPETAPDLRPYIGLNSIAIREDTKDGLAYVDWHLNCTWDDEHGLAAVTHGPRLIDLDSGETDIYKIFADNGTLEEELKLAERYRDQPKRPTPPKPWWKFW